MPGRDPLIEEILQGDNRGLQLLAARGLVPLPPVDLVAVQVRLASSADEEVVESSVAAIAATDARILADLVAETSDDAVLAYLGRRSDASPVLEAIIHRRDVSRTLLAEIAGRIGEELQEMLLLRQDAIIEHPEILDALEKNPEMGRFTKRKIKEYREHLLPRERRPQRSKAELEEAAEALSSEDLVAAINEARDVAAEGDKDEDLTGLSESQIRSLAVPVRMKLARGAPKVLRNILIRDPNPLVAVGVLHHNAMSESEIEQVARNRAVVQEVLETIGSHRSWTRKYSIVVALVKNPRVPVGIAMRYLPRLSVRDLQGLARDRNVADAVRTGAKRLYRMKRG